MINRDFKQFLQKITTEKLQSNLLANVISIYYEDLDFTLSKDKIYESLVKYYKIHRGFINIPKFSFQEPATVVIIDKDYRISSLRLSNFRGFPEPKQDVHYGMNFIRDNQNNSNLVVLGRNGAGKSSIFTALEYIYTNSISEAELRSHKQLDEKQFNKFITHLNKNLNNVTCKIKTNIGEYSVFNKIFNDSELDILNPGTHFISDNRIIENGKLDYDEFDELSFHNLIAKNLGLSEFLNFQNTLEDLKNYKRSKEKIEKSRQEKERIKLEDEIIFWNDQIRKNELIIEKLQENNISLEEINIKNDLSVLSERKNKIIRVDYEIENIKVIMNNFLNAYSLFQSLSKKHINENEIQFLRIGNELLKETVDCPFCESSKKSLEEIKVSITEKLNSTKEYLNQIKLVEDSYFNLRKLLQEIYSIYFEVRNTLRDDIKHLSKHLFLNNLISNENKLLRVFENIYLDRNYDILQNYINIAKPDIISLSNFQEYILDFKDFFVDSVISIIPDIKSLYSERERTFAQLERSLSHEIENPNALDELSKLKYENQNLDLQIKKNRSIIERISQVIEILDSEIIIFNELVSEISQLYNVLSYEVNNIIINSIKPIKDTIEEILSNYVKTNNSEIELDFKIDIENKLGKDGLLRKFITARIIHISKNTGEESNITPDKFFNTFRYRLFSTMVSLSLAIANRMNNNVNLPFVIDDIFYSSDYTHRVEFEVFFEKIISIFKLYDNLENIQFILFTHDEVIFESIVNTLLDKSEIYNKTIFAKLYPPNDLDELPIGDENDKYWELIYRLPNLIEKAANY